MVAAESNAIPQKIEALPDRRIATKQFQPRQKVSRRFHFDFQETAFADVPHAVWIPHLGEGSVVYINNARVQSGVLRSKPLMGTGAESTRYDIPRFLILPGRNRVNIYITSDPTRAGIGPVFLAPVNLVDKASKRAVWMDNLWPNISVAGAFFGLLLNLLACLALKRRTGFICLALLSVATLSVFQFSGVWPLFLIIAFVGVYYAAERRHNSEFNFGLVFLTGLSALGALFGLMRISLPFALPDPALITSLVWLGPLPLIILLPLQAITQAVQARRSRVEVLETELGDTKDDLEREIRRRAIFEERERLTRDIHDGVGGQLLGLLLRLRTGDLPKETIARDLQDGINDLRLVVDALDHTGNDLGRALRAFRDRADNQLDAAGVKLKWTQADKLDYAPQSRDAVLHLYRILQEALNNIIRHAQATHVHVLIEHAENLEGLNVSILDNGIGRETGAKVGHGTLNMQRRSDLLGAKLRTVMGIDGAGHGIVVNLPRA